MKHLKYTIAHHIGGTCMLFCFSSLLFALVYHNWFAAICSFVGMIGSAMVFGCEEELK